MSASLQRQRGVEKQLRQQRSEGMHCKVVYAVSGCPSHCGVQRLENSAHEALDSLKNLAGLDSPGGVS